MSVDLSTTYLGLKLQNPLVISACPLTAEIDQLRRLEEAGAAAAVLPSVFEEQIEHEAAELTKAQEFGTESFAEALTYFPRRKTIARDRKSTSPPSPARSGRCECRLLPASTGPARAAGSAMPR